MEILIKPLITEKMASDTEKNNRFGFIVHPRANKIQIKEAVEAQYNVAVESVNTMNYAGKARSRFTKTGVVKGHTNAYKKAVVTLAKGDEIDFYQNI